MPPHELRLQVGGPIMLLRNMTSGLANGTRLIVTRLDDTVIEAEVLTGPHAGHTELIPGYTITSSDDTSLGFKLTRRQFPIRPAYAMTINKSQGQTLSKVGILLNQQVFGHGQLYVALSRVGTRAGVKVLVHDGERPHTENQFGVAPEGVYATNVVFTEVLKGQ